MILKLKPTTWAAWLWFSMLLVMELINLPTYNFDQDIQASPVKAVSSILSMLIVLVFSLVGALIISSQAQNMIGWLLVSPGLAFLLDVFTQSQIVGVVIPPVNPSIQFWLAVFISNTTWIFYVFPVFMIALLFPNGRPISARWRWVIVYLIALLVFFFSIAFFGKQLSPDSSLYGVDWAIPNPIGFLETSVVDFSLPIFLVGIAVLTILCVASIFFRYRRSSSRERRQIKWLLYAVSLFVTSFSVSLFLQSWGKQDIMSLVQNILVLNIPLAIGIAILREHLWDIDLIIHKTLQYSLLTGLLLLVYAGCVILLQSLTESLFGQQSPLIVVASTLVIASLFNPLRIRIQDFIDRRFYRTKYNAEQTLAQFAASARDEVDMDELVVSLLDVIKTTFQPVQTSLWYKRSDDLPKKT